MFALAASPPAPPALVIVTKTRGGARGHRTALQMRRDRLSMTSTSGVHRTRTDTPNKLDLYALMCEFLPILNSYSYLE